MGSAGRRGFEAKQREAKGLLRVTRDLLLRVTHDLLLRVIFARATKKVMRKKHLHQE
jgi:hypothetical protein